jgi:hypothetical protein
LVNDHDFRSDSTGVAIPYGVSDLLANRGTVMVGVSHDTSAFAAHAIARWWRQEGATRYPRSRQLLILSDTGVKAGSNVVGQVTYTPVPSAEGTVDSVRLSLENVHFKIGEIDVPLRSTPHKASSDVLEYHWLEDTGRIALVLYVARDVTLVPAK